MWKFSLNCQAASLWVFNLYDTCNMTDIMSYSFTRILLCRRQDRRNPKQKEPHQERKGRGGNPYFSSPPKVKVLVAQSCPTLCDSTDCSPLGSSVHGTLEARIPEWVAMSSRWSSRPRDRSHSPAFLYCLSHQEISIHDAPSKDRIERSQGREKEESLTAWHTLSCREAERNAFGDIHVLDPISLTLGILFHPSKPQFPYPWNGDDKVPTSQSCSEFPVR